MDIKSIYKITLFALVFLLSGCIANPYVIPVGKKHPPVIYIPDRSFNIQSVIYPPVVYPTVVYPRFGYPRNYTRPLINNWSRYYFRRKLIHHTSKKYHH